MKTTIPNIESEVNPENVKQWLHQIIKMTGPCFHYDTPAEDYIRYDEKPLFSRKDSERLNRGLDNAIEILGFDVFEDICIKEVWKHFGVYYDSNINLLVPIS